MQAQDRQAHDQKMQAFEKQKSALEKQRQALLMKQAKESAFKKSSPNAKAGKEQDIAKQRSTAQQEVLQRKMRQAEMEKARILAKSGARF